MTAAAIASPVPVRRAAPRLALASMGLPHLLLLALAVRLALLATPLSYFPDEIFQYLEPAHRLAFGSGIVTWEYRLGMRSWLVPAALAGPMRLGDWLAPDSGLYLLCPKLLLVLLSLAPVVAAHALGGRASRAHALFAGFALATWSETALFGTQALTEALATWAVLPAAALTAAPPRGRERHWLAGGALLALAVVLRVQYAPALALLAVLRGGRSLRGWLLLGAGGGAVLLLAAALDLAMGGWPFAWAWAYYRENIVHGRAWIQTDGPFFYLVALAASFGPLLVPMLALAWRARRHDRALLACAVANLAVHSLIAHKEYRYILLTSTIMTLFAALGLVDWLAERRASGRRAVSLPQAAGLWAAASLAVAWLPYPAAAWSRATPALQASAALARAPAPPCGVALAGINWADTGGYAYLHRAVPIYVPDDSGTPPARWLPAAAPAFDAIMAPPGLASALPAGYARGACFPGRHGAVSVCLFRRAGTCDPATARDRTIERVVARIG